MFHINTEDNFNDNIHLIGGILISQSGNKTVYLVKKEGEHIGMETFSNIGVRKVC